MLVSLPHKPPFLWHALSNDACTDLGTTKSLTAHVSGRLLGGADLLALKTCFANLIKPHTGSIAAAAHIRWGSRSPTTLPLYSKTRSPSYEKIVTRHVSFVREG